jgi:hypothetical protein
MYFSSRVSFLLLDGFYELVDGNKWYAFVLLVIQILPLEICS